MVSFRFVLRWLLFADQPPGGGRENAHVAADRLPVHETVAPERPGAESSEQHSGCERFFPNEIDCIGDLRIVETTGFPVGGREIAGTDADSSDSFDFQDVVDIANGFTVLDLHEDPRFFPGNTKARIVFLRAFSNILI